MCVFHLHTPHPSHAHNLPPFPICALQTLASVTSHFPLPSEPVCFCFSSPGSLHRKLYTLGAFRKAESSFPVSAEAGHSEKKNGWMKGVSNSQTPRPGQKQKSAVLLPSLHFPPLFHSPYISKIPATRSHLNTEILKKCLNKVLD